ncbi:hypothetical protein AWZ03_009672 [Drosophila navojoa]|uniref:Uncharacterized protein n=1 Tax=Drosophila navojoa TaxID=7232 RepID=A0A484B4W9_DRONA|nr:hypothetical protein AWZ03_009672 [Drosophila navojoa]
MDAAGNSSNAATAGGATADEAKTLLQQQNASMENDYNNDNDNGDGDGDGNDADEPQALPFCFVRWNVMLGMVPYRIDDRLWGQFSAETFLITASKCELMPSYVPGMPTYAPSEGE